MTAEGGRARFVDWCVKSWDTTGPLHLVPIVPLRACSLDPHLQMLQCLTIVESHTCTRLALLLRENGEVEEFSRYPGHMFLSRECIETLHEVLDIQVSCVPSLNEDAL